MLDLQPRVHLDEPEGPGFVEQELDRSRAGITRRARDGDRGFAELRAQRRVHAGRGRFLDQLLVASLDRAVALAEMHAVPVGIPEDLDLDVARREHGLFQQQAPVAEGVLGLVPRARERGVEPLRRPDQPHAAPAAARERLDDERQDSGLPAPAPDLHRAS